MVQWNIAVLPGDGIGPEITAEAIKVLKAIEERGGHTFNLKYAPFGAQAYFNLGHPFPEETKKICKDADAVLKGPIGLDVKEMAKIPEDLAPEKAALLPLREMLGTDINYRPAVLPAACRDFSPIKNERIRNGIKFLGMRELLGGNYFGKKVEGKEVDMKYAIDEGKYTYEQVANFAHETFKEARKQKKDLTNIGLTSVHKKNVMATSRFWEKVFKDVSVFYPDVKLNSILVDNAAYQMVINPAQFNGQILAMENMQGDILTDEMGGIIGSMGLVPSACINSKTRKCYVEPAHGSAPSIAGQNKANPYSSIGSVAYMLDNLGLEGESKLVWNALTNVLESGYMTDELCVKLNEEEKRQRVSDYVTEFFDLHKTLKPDVTWKNVEKAAIDFYVAKDARRESMVVSTKQFGDLVVSYIGNAKWQ